MSTEIVQTPSIVYPESDGKPVGETDDHREIMFELIFALTNWLRGREAYVAGNLFVYYQEGVPQSMVAPDVFVIFGVPQERWRSYKTWEHGGKAPNLVIELTAAGTRYEDLSTKRVLYAELGVQEYYIFDPLGDYLKPRLRGFQLIDGELLPLPESRMFSRLLNLELRPEGRSLRLVDTATGAPLLMPYEAEMKLQQEAKGRQYEAEARAAAEAEVAQLRAELERLKSGQ